MTQSGYNLNDLVQEAQSRWLKPAEVLFILQNYKEGQLTHKPPEKPASGSLFLFNRRVLRFFRKDGHSWRKKKDGRTVGEAHERLKVGNVEALNCYYAHGEQNPNFQRRSYWMLDQRYEHIVLVHYREISDGRHSSGSPSTISSYTAQQPGSTTVISELYEPCQTHSPESVEVSSDAVVKSDELDHLDRIGREGETSTSSPGLEVSQALRRIEEQLSLNDDTLKEIGPFCNENENSNDSEYIINDQCRPAASLNLNNLVSQQDSGENWKLHQQVLAQQSTVECKDTVSWKEMLEFSTSPPGAESQEKTLCASDKNGILPLHSSQCLSEEYKRSHWKDFGECNSRNASMLFCQQVENLKFHTDSDNFTLYDQGQIGMHLEADSTLTIAKEQKFMIREISPEWGFASEATKVVIVGSFLCDPSEGAWTCMFGDLEVPVQIIQEGVMCCLAPPHLPGKVTLCITSGNRESCSEVREFEYRVQPISCAHCNSSHNGTTKSPEELLLLVRFVQMLLSDPSVLRGDITESGLDPWGKSQADEDSWGNVIEALSIGSWTSSSTTYWLLQELVKDKLQQWLSRSQGGCYQQGCSLSRKEQGVIHMVAGLGFEWALSPILNSGVGINFRDNNGWTALHWAAHFGREKMVAALIASGASAGAVTDPNSLDPTGKTPASIAAARGHKGLAGYLSEVALTSHLLSLTLEGKELSKGSADVEAEIAVNCISQRSFTTYEDQHSLKDTLAAVRNAALAAARIQAAFRAHSFRRRQQTEAASDDAASSFDEYDILSNDSYGISVASKLAFRSAHEYNTAACSIQKKFRGWKGRKDFLAFRRKVVKIQAHVRGHQVRKQYKVICWAVGVLEKVVLRWRRKGVGLRGFRKEIQSIDESEDEDILKVFRKQKVEGAIDEAVSTVRSMVDSPDARLQYSRVLERYRQAKAELADAESEVTCDSHCDVSYMENECEYQYP
ncbi:hypothetical protein U1Q18_028971 [Sarracenia purpurea var. burkii]